MRKRHDTYEQLYKRLQELSMYDIVALQNMSKKNGCEAIPYSDFNNSFKSILDQVEVVSKDSKLCFVFETIEFLRVTYCNL